MIPAIRTLIDEANNAVDHHGDGDNDGHRICIPSSALSELRDFRRKAFTLQAREESNSKILEMTEAADRAGEGDEIGTQRPYGLPQGEACDDIWELIFQHVDDVEDIANLCDTCVLFWELLDRKYTTLRFIQVASKFAHKFGGFTSLLNLRRVCKSSKATVDKLLCEDKLLTDVNLPENWVYKTRFRFRPEEPSLHRFRELSAGLQSLQMLDPEHLPVKVLLLSEVRSEDDTHAFHTPDPVFLGNNPLLPSLRSQCQLFLTQSGRCIRAFEYISVTDCHATYIQLRSWVPQMPLLEELTVLVAGEPRNLVPGNPPEGNIDPFPICPRLKRYISPVMGLTASYAAQVFQANPGISEVFLYYRPQDWGAEDFPAYLTTLESLKLDTFMLTAANGMPPHQLLQFRPQWPLKQLLLLNFGEDEETSSKDLFAFVNSFKKTLEELTVIWKIRDIGGYLDLPKVSKLYWKLWPNFMSLDLMIPLESLSYLDLDVVACHQLNNSAEIVRGFVNANNNLLSAFPSLRKIRVLMDATTANGIWIDVWKT